jgi:hypothetical protein
MTKQQENQKDDLNESLIDRALSLGLVVTIFSLAFVAAIINRRNMKKEERKS